MTKTDCSRNTELHKLCQPLKCTWGKLWARRHKKNKTAPDMKGETDTEKRKTVWVTQWVRHREIKRGKIAEMRWACLGLERWISVSPTTCAGVNVKLLRPDKAWQEFEFGWALSGYPIDLAGNEHRDVSGPTAPTKAHLYDLSGHWGETVNWNMSFFSSECTQEIQSIIPRPFHLLVFQIRCSSVTHRWIKLNSWI